MPMLLEAPIGGHGHTLTIGDSTVGNYNYAGGEWTGGGWTGEAEAMGVDGTMVVEGGSDDGGLSGGEGGSGEGRGGGGGGGRSGGRGGVSQFSQQQEEGTLIPPVRPVSNPRYVCDGEINLAAISLDGSLRGGDRSQRLMSLPEAILSSVSQMAVRGSGCFEGWCVTVACDT